MHRVKTHSIFVIDALYIKYAYMYKQKTSCNEYRIISWDDLPLLVFFEVFLVSINYNYFKKVQGKGFEHQFTGKYLI